MAIWLQGSANHTAFLKSVTHVAMSTERSGDMYVPVATNAYSPLRRTQKLKAKENEGEGKEKNITSS